MRSKKGARWGIFTIQDMTGVQELLAFPESFARLEQVLKPGNPLLLKVRVQVEEAGTRLSLQEARRLEEMAERAVSGELRVRIEIQSLSEDALDRLEDLFAAFAGIVPGRVRIVLPGRLHGRAASATAREKHARIGGSSPGNLWPPRRSNGAGMRPKEKTKAAAPPPARSKRERPPKEIERLEKDVEELRHLAGNADADAELQRVRDQVGELRREFYTHMGPWQRAQIARHQQRPYTLDFIGLLFTDFIELHGDRGYATTRRSSRDWEISRASRGYHRPSKGRDTKQRLVRNFGQPKPEVTGKRYA